MKLTLSKWFPIENQYWNSSKSKKGYAGTAILISNELRERPISVTNDFGIAKHADEGRSITAEFSNFTLVSTYVPNAGVMGLNRLDYRVKEWDVDFFGYVKGLESKGKPVILCGDLNVALNEMDLYGAKGKERNAGYTIEERTSFG